MQIAELNGSKRKLKKISETKIGSGENVVVTMAKSLLSQQPIGSFAIFGSFDDDCGGSQTAIYLCRMVQKDVFNFCLVELELGKAIIEDDGLIFEREELFDFLEEETIFYHLIK